MAERIVYEIEDRDVVYAQIIAEDKAVVNDVTIDLDENGRHTTCYFDVIDAPPPPPEDEATDLQAYYDGMSEVLDDE